MRRPPGSRGEGKGTREARFAILAHRRQAGRPFSCLPRARAGWARQLQNACYHWRSEQQDALLAAQASLRLDCHTVCVLLLVCVGHVRVRLLRGLAQVPALLLPRCAPVEVYRHPQSKRVIIHRSIAKHLPLNACAPAGARRTPASTNSWSWSELDSWTLLLPAPRASRRATGCSPSWPVAPADATGDPGSSGTIATDSDISLSGRCISGCLLRTAAPASGSMTSIGVNACAHPPATAAALPRGGVRTRRGGLLLPLRANAAGAMTCAMLSAAAAPEAPGAAMVRPCSA